MLKDEIEKELTGFRIRCQNAKDCCDEELFKGLESQALTRILELVEKCVPEKIIGVRYDRESNSQKYKEGYNQALTEIKRRIGELNA